MSDPSVFTLRGDNFCVYYIGLCPWLVDFFGGSDKAEVFVGSALNAVAGAIGELADDAREYNDEGELEQPEHLGLGLT